MTKKMNWAILGTGKIANRFAAAINNIPEKAVLYAVGSRNQDTADAFGDQYNISKRYKSYEEVAADPAVDIVYVGTPGAFHHRDVIMCLNNGKHVLCEKAFTTNSKEAKDLIDTAREKNLFLMEAMWTRFFPIHIKIREILKEDVIGRVNGMVINFMATPPYDPKNRFFDVNLGASVLLDTGSYGISWAYSLLGKPDQVHGFADFGESGADNQAAIMMKYKSGQLVSILSSQVSYDKKDATIFGTNGNIVVHDPWYKPTTMTINRYNQDPEVITIPMNGYNGYEFEAMAVMDCIQAGKLESETIPHAETLQIMGTLDEIRNQWGFKFPSEM
ncbi:MAG: Gfo/Idh/MocA family oxidoreductase [Bacteroidetes bacterium]|jgi:predicted dehydrogenase|nr:Gfo/Idh/MocA family oxidoreductase [Bacteroidota bacterium]